MVPGDYYVARVRPTGWLLRPRILSPVPPTAALLSTVLLLRLSFSRTARLVPMYEYTECACGSLAYTRTHTPVGHGPHGRSRLRTRANPQIPASLGGEGRRADVSGILSEQKARKQNAIMISPKDGWSKLPQIRVPAPRMAMRRSKVPPRTVRHAVKLVLRIDRKLTHTETTRRNRSAAELRNNESPCARAHAHAHTYHVSSRLRRYSGASSGSKEDNPT